MDSITKFLFTPNMKTIINYFKALSVSQVSSVVVFIELLLFLIWKKEKNVYLQ